MLPIKGFPFVDPIGADPELAIAAEAEPLTEEDFKDIARRAMRKLYSILIEEYEDAT